MAVRVEVAQQIIGVALVNVHAFGDMRLAQHPGQLFAHGGSADPADVRLGVDCHQELSPLGQDWMEINTYADLRAEPQD